MVPETRRYARLYRNSGGLELRRAVKRVIAKRVRENQVQQDLTDVHCRDVHTGTSHITPDNAIVQTRIPARLINLLEFLPIFPSVRTSPGQVKPCPYYIFQLTEKGRLSPAGSIRFVVLDKGTVKVPVFHRIKKFSRLCIGRA